MSRAPPTDRASVRTPASDYPESNAIAASSDAGGKSNDNALNLKWVLGFNKDMLGGVHNLSDEYRRELFYSAAHTGVIFNFETGEQRLLQGHCNPITCCTVSRDKRWIVTADSGTDSMIVIWDSMSGIPIKTIFNPHPTGTQAIDLSPDSMFLATVSCEEKQTLSVWEWTAERDGPLYTASVPEQDRQTCVRFNSSNIREISTNGARRVVFWSWAGDSFEYYSPALSGRDFKQKMGDFTQTVFVPNTTQAVTATADGDIVVWDISLIVDGLAKPDERRAIKVVRLCNEGAINFIGLQDDYVVTGSADGCVRFYDVHFRVIAWFEDLDAGAVTSISFSAGGAADKLNYDDMAGDSFQCPDFIVGTSSALVVHLHARMFDELDPENRKGTLLLQGLDSPVHGLATHPKLPIFATCGYSGFVQLWNYETRGLLLVKVFDRLVPHCIAYDSKGELLAVGFTNGTLKILSADKLTEIQTFRLSRECLTKIAFSETSRHVATADADRSVCFFRIGHRHDDRNLPEEWIFSGKNRAHARSISGLSFGLSRDGEVPRIRLVSVGEDRKLVEYDVANSTEYTGLLIDNMSKVEQEARPTCCIWYPESGREELILTVNDEYKLKLWNANNKSCRRTVLGPTYGGAVTRLVNLPAPNRSGRYLAYATRDKVVGIIKLPLDGNPNKTMGLIAHPGEVAEIACSHDGRYMLTCGGADLCVNMWAVDVLSMENSIILGGHGIDPYIALIEGGREGTFFAEIRDYFHYSQIRSKNENTTRPRRLDGKIPLQEIPNLMRALGYYPSEQEVENIANEVKYSEFTQTGEYVSSIDFDQFIKLYVSHRPVFGVGKQQIVEAFNAIGADLTGGFLNRDSLIAALLKEGECLSMAELENCLKSLIGDSSIRMLPDELDAQDFAENVLGFEEYSAQDSQQPSNTLNVYSGQDEDSYQSPQHSVEV
eukprot:GILK01001931.1.p1 GENE.GILK01001931.1~~GILK01001931.1.p1  ORF type:complete len:943 (-),score=124.32 GILK01001931.1:124-2952(-)